MRKLLCLLLCGALMLGLAACGDAEPDVTEPTQPTEETYIKVYVDDPTVNQFITAIYEAGDMQLLGTSRGEYEGQYILYTNDCEVTVSATQYGLYVDICGGRTEKSLERVFSLFRYFSLAVDKSCTAQRLDDTISLMKEQGRNFGSYRVSNYVKVLAYTPLSTEPTVSIDCHVEMLLMNYLPL